MLTFVDEDELEFFFFFNPCHKARTVGSRLQSFGVFLSIHTLICPLELAGGVN